MTRNSELHEAVLRRNRKNLLAKDLLKHLLLYRELKAEHEEILRHKWLESEKRGHDVGFNLAMIDWRMKHRSQWRRERQEKRFALTFQI